MRNLEIKLLATKAIIKAADKGIEDAACVKDFKRMEYFLWRKQINQLKINTLQDEIQRTRG